MVAFKRPEIPPDPKLDPGGWAAPPVAGSVTGATIGISLSGGGYRATMFGLGALAAVFDSGHWSSVRWVASVSGGSFANAAAALLPQAPSVVEIDGFISQAVSCASSRWSLIGRPAWRRRGIGAVFEAGIATAWLGDSGRGSRTLSSLQRPDRLHAFMAVDLDSLQPVALTDRIIQCVGADDEDHIAHPPGDLPLATAVRASASFPGLPAVRVRPSELGAVGDFPLTRDLFLGDGGNWNNLGTNWEDVAKWLDRRHGFLPEAIPPIVDLHLVVDASARLSRAPRWCTGQGPLALDRPAMSLGRSWLAAYRSAVLAHSRALRDADLFLPDRVLLATLDEPPTSHPLAPCFLRGDDRPGWDAVREHNQNIGTWAATLRGLERGSCVHLAAHGYGLVAALLVERGVDPSRFEVPHERIRRCLP